MIQNNLETIFGIALVLFAIVVLALLLARLVGRNKARVYKRLADEFATTAGPDKGQQLFQLDDKGQLASQAMPDARPGVRQRFATMVLHSGLGITPSKLLTIAGGCALLLGALIGIWRGNPFIGAGAAVLGAVVPLLYARHRAKARDERLLVQLPEILDLLGRFLRSGHSLSEAFQAVAQEFTDPVRAIFTRCVGMQDLGLPPDVALRDLADNAGLPEYRIVVLAILVQQQTGGSLADVCDRLANVVRERFRVKGMIRSLTAEGRMQANILMGLPPALFLIMLGLKPSYAYAMLNQPALLAGIVVSQVIGILWIRKIVNIKF